MNNDWGMKIMKKGKDITSNNPLDYVFWSKIPSFVIKQRGSTSLTTTRDQYGEPIVARKVIPHNFGYKPQFMAFTTSYASQYLNKYVFDIMDYVNLNFEVSYVDMGQNITESVMAHVTEEDLVIDATIYGWSPYFSGSIGIEWTYNIDYILFMEEAEPIPI